MSQPKGGVPWQAASRNNNKKFSYKSKTNKTPLRDKLKQAEAQRLMDEADREAKVRANKALAERMKRDRELKADMMKQKHPSNGILKNSSSKTSKLEAVQNSSDFVTLTQDQLKAILQTLSKVQGNENGVQLDVENKNQLKLTLEKPDSEFASRESTQSIVPTSHKRNAAENSSQQHLESVLNLSRKVKTSGDMTDRSTTHQTDNEPNHEARRSRRDREKHRTQKQVIMNFDLGSNKLASEPVDQRLKRGKNSTSKSSKHITIQPEDSFDRDEPVFVRGPGKIVTIDEPPQDRVTQPVPEDSTNRDPEPTQPVALDLSPRQKMLLIPRAHMTKAEKKRLQWDLENEAMEKLRLENEDRAKRLGLYTKQQDSKPTVDNTQPAKQVLKGQTFTEQNSRQMKPSPRKAPKSTAGAKADQPALTLQQKREAVKFVEPNFVPGLGDISDNSSRPDNVVLKSEPVIQQPSQPSIRQPAPQPVVQKPAHQAPQILSKAEQKRLQWNKERAEQQADYDPWGRPGVGVGPTFNQPAQATQQNPPTFQPIQSQVSVEPPAVPALKLEENPLRGPYQEPASGVPTSLLGVENPPREIYREVAAPARESLTKTQLLKLKWQQDRAIDQGDYNPFGKPGAGAPIRTDSGTVLTSYHDRQKQMLKKSMEYHQTQTPRQQGQAWQGNQQSAQQFQDHQNHQSRMAEITSEPPHVPGLDLNGSNNQNNLNLSGGQQNIDQLNGNQDSGQIRSHVRGQLINVDPQTLKEREELRRRELKYQEDIRHQVEEKARLKKEERLRNQREEAEEEAKYRALKNNEVMSTHTVREKTRQKEVKELNRTDLVAEAMQRAKQEAELIKARKRLEKLQAAGHDISHLKAAYEEKFSPRVGPMVTDLLTPRKDGAQTSQHTDILSPRVMNSQATRRTVEPTHVPGLELSPRVDHSNHHGATSRTGHTSRRSRIDGDRFEKENYRPMKESGVQTDTPVPPENMKKKVVTGTRKVDPKLKKQVRVISGPKARKPVSEAKPWGYKNNGGKKFTAQSKRDPNYEAQQDIKEERKQARTELLLKQTSPRRKPKIVVEANRKHVPDGRLTRASEDFGESSNRAKGHNYTSPRHKLNERVSPRSTNTQLRISRLSEASPRRGGESAVPLKSHRPPTISETARHPDIQSNRAQQRVSGYELPVPEHLRISPVEGYNYIRSDVVLSPSNAQEQPPMSREATQAAMAREAYYKSMQPAQYGVHMHNIRDVSHQQQASRYENHAKDPLYNPSVVTKHPTERQQQMLDSLRQMKQGLMAKRREIESTINSDELYNAY